jgi:hypothetical protein
MKIIRYRSMILSLCMKFILMWIKVVLCGRECPKYSCSVKNFHILSHLKPSVSLQSFVRNGIHYSFKYASDFIWVLGKNNFDSLRPAGCFRYRQADCCNYVLQLTEAVQLMSVDYRLGCY